MRELVAHDNCENRFQLKHIIKQLVQNLRDWTALSYGAMKERREHIVGKEKGKAGELKKKLINMIVDKDTRLLNQGLMRFKEFQAEMKLIEEQEKAEIARLEAAKKEILKRMTDKSYNLMKMATSQLIMHKNEVVLKERNMLLKQRGICNQLKDSGVRLMGMGFRKLVEFSNLMKANYRNKMRVIVNRLTDQKMNHKTMAYTMLKQEKIIEQNIGSNNSEEKKINFIKKIVSHEYQQQGAAINSLKMFLQYQRMLDEQHGQMKKAICLRFMSSNNRQMGQALRMLEVNVKEMKEKEANVWKKIKGICYRIKDSQGRL